MGFTNLLVISENGNNLKIKMMYFIFFKNENHQIVINAAARIVGILTVMIFLMNF